MLRWASFVLVVFLAGCSGGGTSSDDKSVTTTSTGPVVPELPPAPPFVDVRDNMELRVAMAGDGGVYRVRLFAFDEFVVDSIASNAGGAGNAQPYGMALFAADQSPANALPCSPADLNATWDGRASAQDPDWTILRGVYDLWLWSSTGDGLILDINGGGANVVNVTGRAHNWTSSDVTATVATSGPAQTVATFSATIPVAKFGLFLGGFTPANGYPTEQASTKVESGAVCDEATFAGGGNGFMGNPRMVVAAYLAAGDATWSGEYSTPVSPTGVSSAAGVVIVPTEG